MIWRVIINRTVERQLERMPRHVARKLLEWMDAVEGEGLETVRRVPGYHDEPLRGHREGQRSIRLSRGYRAFYTVTMDGTAEVAIVEEVGKHDY